MLRNKQGQVGEKSCALKWYSVVINSNFKYSDWHFQKYLIISKFVTMKSEAKSGKASKEVKENKERVEVVVEEGHLVPGEEQLTISEMENVTTVFRPHYNVWRAGYCPPVKYSFTTEIKLFWCHVVTTEFRYFETGLREATILPKVNMVQVTKVTLAMPISGSVGRHEDARPQPDGAGDHRLD